MAKARPMDRLVCGMLALAKPRWRWPLSKLWVGEQVAVLVPTTVLAEQHLRSFRERFAGFPFRIEGLSRLRTREEAQAVLRKPPPKAKLMSWWNPPVAFKDVAFSDLGLVVIDEEQRLALSISSGF